LERKFSGFQTQLTSRLQRMKNTTAFARDVVWPDVQAALELGLSRVDEAVAYGYDFVKRLAIVC
jgi:hypothetical protein